MSDVQEPQAQAPEQVSEAPVVEQPFHVWKTDTGDEMKFNTPDDMNKYLSSSTMRKNHYRKTASDLSNARKALEEKQRAFDEDRRNFESMTSEARQINDYLKNLPPHQYDFIKKQMSQQQPKGDPEVLKRLEALEKEREEVMAKQKEEAENRRIHDALRNRYADYDEKAARDFLNDIYSGPDPGVAFMDMVYGYLKNKPVPQQQIAERKQSLQTPIKGVKPQQAGSIPANFEEAAELANNIDLGG